LNPADVLVYPYKKDLIRKTRLLSPWIITAISSAAILMLAWILWPDSSEPSQPMAKTETVLPDTQKPLPESQQQIAESGKAESINLHKDSRPDKSVPGTQNLKPDIRSSMADPRSPGKQDLAKNKALVPTGSPREFIPMESLSHKVFIAGPRIPEPDNIRLLYASSASPASFIYGSGENVLTLPQYALQLFREKILGEDKLIVRRTRFSMWEVAGAGVNGINSLVGTKMKLSREYDEQGDIQAVSFNSRLIDVEKPVRSPENK